MVTGFRKAGVVACACVPLTFFAGLSPAQSAGAAADLPPGYTYATRIDSRGCAYQLSETGQWRLATEVNRGLPCGAGGAKGAISPLTGYPVPPGYRVVWDDGRLNPHRGLPAR